MKPPYRPEPLQVTKLEKGKSRRGLPQFPPSPSTPSMPNFAPQKPKQEVKKPTKKVDISEYVLGNVAPVLFGGVNSLVVIAGFLSLMLFDVGIGAYSITNMFSGVANGWALALPFSVGTTSVNATFWLQIENDLKAVRGGWFSLVRWKYIWNNPAILSKVVFVMLVNVLDTFAADLPALNPILYGKPALEFSILDPAHTPVAYLLMVLFIVLVVMADTFVIKRVMDYAKQYGNS